MAKLFKKRQDLPDLRQTVEALKDAPVIDLIIRYDGRTNQVAVMAIGGQLTPEGAYQLLEMARGVIRTMELEAIRKDGDGKAPPMPGGAEITKGS